MRSATVLLLFALGALAACEDDADAPPAADTGMADAVADAATPRDLADTADTADAAGPIDTADAAEAGDAVETGEVAEAGDAADATDASDVSDLGFVLPSDGPPVLAVILTPPNPSIIPGRTLTMRATAVHPDGSSDVTWQATWTSSRPDVARPVGAGLIATFMSGQSTISAEYQGVTGSTNLTVTTVALTGVVVMPASASVARGTTRKFTAHLSFADDTFLEDTENAQWSVDHPAIATVSNQVGQRGLVQALAEGQTTVRAMLAGLTGTATLTVTAP